MYVLREQAGLCVWLLVSMPCACVCVCVCLCVYLCVYLCVCVCVFARVPVRQPCGHALTQYEELADSLGLTLGELRAKHESSHAAGGGPPSQRSVQLYSAWLRARAGAYNAAAALYNGSWGWAFGGKRMAYTKAVVPMNHAELIDVLLRIHAHQIFVDGVFNADPHPGNILLTPDDSERRRPPALPLLLLLLRRRQRQCTCACSDARVRFGTAAQAHRRATSSGSLTTGRCVWMSTYSSSSHQWCAYQWCVWNVVIGW
jgi:hypothetical protein